MIWPKHEPYLVEKFKLQDLFPPKIEHVHTQVVVLFLKRLGRLDLCCSHFYHISLRSYG